MQNLLCLSSGCLRLLTIVHRLDSHFKFLKLAELQGCKIVAPSELLLSRRRLIEHLYIALSCGILTGQLLLVTACCLVGHSVESDRFVVGPACEGLTTIPGIQITNPVDRAMRSISFEVCCQMQILLLTLPHLNHAVSAARVEELLRLISFEDIDMVVVGI